MNDVEFAHVPSADPSAPIDQHWLELRGGSGLPAAYLPPSMPGRRSVSTRAIAAAIVAMFLAATAAGACMTYGPDPFGLR